MKFQLLLVKRLIEDVIMLPFILIGRIISLLYPLQKHYDVFFFFPFYHTGGAEKVHSLIAKAIGGNKCIIFFTKKSHNNAFLKKFEATGCDIKDISRYTDNKLLYFVNIVFRGIVSGYINRQNKKPVVFNGQCNFGYKIAPWINRNIRQIELIHSISNFSYIRIPFLPFITKTVMISVEKIKEHLSLYRRFNIPGTYDSKISYIANTSEFDLIDPEEKDFSHLVVFYSGRATTEKRAYLVAEIAKKVHSIEPDIRFVMAGDEFAELRSATTDFIDFMGNISDEQSLKTIYKQSHVVLITSSTEGFPLAVIEGMAYGNAILATPVGDLPVHIKESENGYLFSTIKDEEKVITEATAYILELYKKKELVKQISRNNIAYAQDNFSYTKFANAYSKIIFQ